MTWFGVDGFGFTYYPDVDRPGARIAATEEGEVLQEVTIHAPKEKRFFGRFLGDGDLSGVSMLFVNDDRTVGFGADVQEGGDFVVEKLHPGEYTIQVRADEEGYLVEGSKGPSGALRWFTVPEVGDGFAEIDLTPAGSVTGVVRDRGDGSPVYGASVVVLGEEGARLASAVTGRDGAVYTPGYTRR